MVKRTEDMVQGDFEEKLQVEIELVEQEPTFLKGQTIRAGMFFYFTLSAIIGYGLVTTTHMIYTIYYFYVVPIMNCYHSLVLIN